MQKENLPATIDDQPDEVKANLKKYRGVQDLLDTAKKCLQACKIETIADIDTAMGYLKEAKIVSDKIEEKRKQLVGPYNKVVKEYNDHAKKLTEGLPEEITGLKNKILEFQDAQEKLRVAAIKAARHNQLTELGFIKQSEHVYMNGDVPCSAALLSLPDENWSEMIKNVIEQLEQRRIVELTTKQNILEDLEIFGTEDQIKEHQAEVEKLGRPVGFSSGSYINTAPAATHVKGTTKRWTFEVTDPELVPRQYLHPDASKIQEAVKTGTRDIPGIRIFQTTGLSIR